MKRSTLFAALCSVLLGACASTCPPAPAPALDVKTVTANVAVPVPCIDKLPAAPDLLSDQALLTGSGQQVIDQLWRDHVQQRDYTQSLSAALESCKQ